MTLVFWCVSCFLVICARSTEALVIDHLVKIFGENDSSAIDQMQLFIPTVNSDNDKCREHSRFYARELKKLKLWATEMSDATSKFPSGILYGSAYDLGNFDQCVEVKVPYKQEEFSGKYCTAKLTFIPPSYFGANHKVDYDRDDYTKYFNISAYEKITDYDHDKSKASRNELYVSFCLPSSCAYTDLRQSLQELIDKYHNFISNNTFEVNLNINDRNCQVKTDMPYSLAEITFISHLIDADKDRYTERSILNNTGKYYQTGAFSEKEFVRFLGKNFFFENAPVCQYLPVLFKMDHPIYCASESKNEDGLDCIAGLKVLSMFCIIMGHRCMFTLGYPVVNPKFVEEIYTKVEATTILNGPIIVDTFFIISGFLATYLTMKLFEKVHSAIERPYLEPDVQEHLHTNSHEGHPYLVGIATGWLKYKMKQTDYKMPRHILYVGWTLCLFVSLTTIHTAFVFYLPQVPHDTIFSALYASMHHFTFGISIGWIILAVSSGNGAWIEPILSWRPLIYYLSRITYRVFDPWGNPNVYSVEGIWECFAIMYDTFGDIVLAYIIGFILTMYFEAPIVRLENLIFGKGDNVFKTGRGKKENLSSQKKLARVQKKILDELVICEPKIKSISQHV
ncbi:hypothetical protein NQ317_006024 [Molorchus minor]|uniref:Nose resistant-to-fluoxetine protein N-terminal domain-containing protein n=1 Tax=Molorchus minor TaxID=1323400 RepID=A0ABQ9K4S8_9CUCU|nr:hypothetical protein NQ317_006024 [Molorchus minor]